VLSLRREVVRKALHASSAAVPLAYAAGLPRGVVLPVLLALVGVAAAVEVARRRSARARERFLSATGVLLRAHEHHRVSGATWLLASFALAVALYPRAVAVAAMWGVAVGDASAALVGRLAAQRRAARSAALRTPAFPTSPLPAPAGKTVAGSVACFAVTLVGALTVARLGAAESAVAALAAALAERPAHPLDDNVRIVAAVGVAVLLWRLASSVAAP
jgi:dolichol kinase